MDGMENMAKCPTGKWMGWGIKSRHLLGITA